MRIFSGFLFSIITLFVAGNCYANNTPHLYTSYESFYVTLPDRLFDIENKKPLEFSFTHDGNPINFGHYKIADNDIYLEISGENITINHQNIPSKQRVLFNDEQITDTTLAAGATIYFSQQAAFRTLVCIEGNIF